MLRCKSLNIDEYFKRIGYDGSRSPDLETLRKLSWCHVKTVPQDIIDMFGGPRKELELEKIYNDVVNNHRGGFCYELNGLFGSLLEKLGYKLALLQGSGYLGSKDTFNFPYDHLMLKVTLDDCDWLADIGYGAPSFFEPMKYEMMTEQTQMTGIYRLRKASEENTVYVEKHRKKIIHVIGDETVTKSNSKVVASNSKYIEDENWNIVFKFSTVHQKFENFEVGFNKHVDIETDFLRENSFLEIFTDSSVYILWGRNFIEKQLPDTLTEKVTCRLVDDDEELKEIMKEKFGVELNFKPDLKSKAYKAKVDPRST